MASVNRARVELAEMLAHWKGGTKPGDNEITSGNVACAIQALLEAIVERHDETQGAHGGVGLQ